MIPIEALKHLSQNLNIDLKVLDESYFPLYNGGSKARKIIPILEEASKQGANALVSCGSSGSNHARVVALAAAKLGWKCHLVIHDKEDYSKANLQLMRLAGAKLSFCDLSDISVKMNEAMLSFKNENLNPYYIWGGGHCIEGTQAYYSAVHEYRDELLDWSPDYVFVASGTGGTQAGLHLGFKELFPKTKVVGISVAREKNSGQKVVYEEVNDLAEKLGLPLINKEDVLFHDEWVGPGHGKIYPKLLDAISYAAKEEGLITDSTYTGKVICAIFDMVEDEIIPKDAKVLFWHTGGIFNLCNIYKEG